MKKFKVGDMVIRVQPSNRIIVGREYKVRSVSPSGSHVRLDGCIGTFATSAFELIESAPAMNYAVMAVIDGVPLAGRPVAFRETEADAIKEAEAAATRTPGQSYRVFLAITETVVPVSTITKRL
jgi:hypothetical protein